MRQKLFFFNIYRPKITLTLFRLGGVTVTPHPILFLGELKKYWLYTYCLSPKAYRLNALIYLFQTKSKFRPTSSPRISTLYSLLQSLQHIYFV